MALHRGKKLTSALLLSLLSCLSLALVFNFIVLVYNIQEFTSKNGPHLLVADTQPRKSLTGDPGSDVVISTSLSLPTHKKFAYAFYATDEEHACGAFVNVAALRDTGTRNETDFVILTYGFDNSKVREQASKMNVIVKDVEYLNMPRGGNGYYQNVMVKLRVFQLFEYDRIIFMDTDMMVRRNLDHLFFLPETSHIAGPRVYFQHFDGRPNYFCSCLMVLTPSQHMWERIMGHFDEDGYVREQEMYDMDLLNKEFVDEATILPGIYELLTAHLESENEWHRCLRDLPFMDKKLGMPNKSWEEIYNASSVVHFTGLKPTIDRTLDAIKAKKGASDPRFFAIYERYFSLAFHVCPFYPGYSASDFYSQYL